MKPPDEASENADRWTQHRAARVIAGRERLRDEADEQAEDDPSENAHHSPLSLPAGAIPPSRPRAARTTLRRPFIRIRAVGVPRSRTAARSACRAHGHVELDGVDAPNAVLGRYGVAAAGARRNGEPGSQRGRPHRPRGLAEMSVLRGQAPLGAVCATITHVF
jgi:hypothetical protein